MNFFNNVYISEVKRAAYSLGWNEQMYEGGPQAHPEFTTGQKRAYKKGVNDAKKQQEHREIRMQSLRENFHGFAQR